MSLQFEGAELQEINMIEMLLEQSDQFPEGKCVPSCSIFFKNK